MLFEKFALLGLGTLLALVVLEGGFRLYLAFMTTRESLDSQLARSEKILPDEKAENVSLAGLIQPSSFSDVVYELKPNLHVRFQGKQVATNSAGFRDREYSREKPKDTFRIIGLGDSIMFGWGVNDGAAYLDLLEQRLNIEPQKHFEVLNFAVPGFNTAMEVSLFEHKAIEYQPDLVIVHFVNNDLQIPAFMQPPKDLWTFRRSYVFDFVETRMKAAAPEHGLIGTEIARMPEQAREEVSSQYHWMVGNGGFDQAMDRLARLTKARHIPVLIIAGKATSGQRKLLRNVAKKYGFQRMKVGPAVERYLHAHQLQLDSAQRRKLLTVSPVDAHPNELGHQIYADALLGKLKKMNIAPAASQ